MKNKMIDDDFDDN